ncbi:MAG: sulfatase [Candidatus Schekmanbacteria bacterium]|nr:sulfatase [Candidatus Schekmanbacteria bacterium]
MSSLQKPTATSRFRALLTVLAAGAAALALGGPQASAAAAPRPDQRPHIVFILVDDLDERTSPYWEAMPETRRLLADRGMTFANAFVADPICCPSRAALLTGKYAHNNGVYTNGGEYGGWGAFVNPLDREGNPITDEQGQPLNNEDRTIARYLNDEGYRTALIGKYLNGIESDPYHIPAGWSEWYGGVSDRLKLYMGYGYTLHESDDGMPGKLVTYGVRSTDYFTDVVARHAKSFIGRAEKRDDDQPFFLVLAPTAPHLPIPPARRHKELAKQWEGKLPKSPNYIEPDLSDKPYWLQLSGDNRARRMGWNEVDFVNRMGSLYAVDEMVAGVIAALDRAGELDNTYLVFSSDNGYNLGAHRLLHKMAPYEESIRVPMVIAGPGIAPASTAERMALNIDLAPTFLDMAGLPIPNDMDGRSLLPILHRRPVTRPWRHDFLIEYKVSGALNGIGNEIPDALWYLVIATDIPGYQALRSEGFTYIEWKNDLAQDWRTEYELYDLRKDPYQLNNLLSTPAGWLANAGRVELMQSRMQELTRCAGETCQ